MSNFSNFIIKRVGQSIVGLFGLSVLVFFISRTLPGDPIRFALGPHATDAQVDQYREDLGLDEPLVTQYLIWLRDVFAGDWGHSLQTQGNVFTDILATLPATIELVLVALIVAITFAIPFGVIAATNKDQWPDHLSRMGALLGVSMPRFWVAILFQIIFFGMLGILPLTGRISGTAPPTVTGLYLIDSLIAVQWETFIDAVRHLILPATALGLATLAQVMRLLRSDMIEEARKDYIVAARANGLPTNLIYYKYMLKNAFSSSLTVIGLAFGFLIGNAFLIEIVFAWPGMARYGVRAMLRGDLNAIVGVTMVVGIAFALANLVVDLLYGYLDPRIRYGGET